METSSRMTEKSGSTGTPSSAGSSGSAVPPQERDEDSGLHDIRSMASSTKMRLSSRRTSTSPPVDEDILASSSAGWKAVALPEPAKMVSLPALDELPSVEEVQKADRKSKKELKAERTSASKVANAAIAIDTAPISAAVSPAPVAKPVAREIEKPAAAAPAATPIVGARFSKAPQKSRTGLYAALGLGLAAAAGVGWYVSTQMNKKAAAPQVAAVEERAAAPQSNTAGAGSAAAVAAPTVEPIAPPPAAEPAADTAVATGMSGAASAAPGGGADEGKADEAGRGKAKNAVAKGRREEEKKGDVTKPVETKPDPASKDAAKPADKKAEGGEGEPSFDALLKEAGVQDKKPAKVVLEKKSLSGADIKKGMSALDGKAQSCYAGTQGTASVKLTVTPDGKVEKVSVSGVFAGTPVASCIESAVKGASFPAWDGGPQSFGYSYLLAE